MKTIIAGSRPKYWPADLDYINEINLAVSNSRFGIMEVVSGMADGFDKEAVIWARGVGLPEKLFPVTSKDWNKHGNRAGYLRNEKMAAYSQALIAIWDGSSRGTEHMIKIARREKLAVYVHIPGVQTTELTGTIDIASPSANIYGCQPCPRCGGIFRCNFCDTREHISCDCGFMEPITKDVF